MNQSRHSIALEQFVNEKDALHFVLVTRDLFLIVFVVCLGALRHSLQDRLSKISGKRSDEIYLKLRTSTGVFALVAPMPLTEECEFFPFKD